jgi:hypothetical protein
VRSLLGMASVPFSDIGWSILQACMGSDAFKNKKSPRSSAVAVITASVVLHYRKGKTGKMICPCL